MSRHLISATLTSEAYSWYKEWSRERKGSERLSECIVAHASGFAEYEHLIKWRNGRLKLLIRMLVEKIDRDDWFSMDEWDRCSIWDLAKTKSDTSPNMKWDIYLEGHPIDEKKKNLTLKGRGEEE